MAATIRDNKTITELQAEPDYEWKDGDDTALYDEGYYEGVMKTLSIIDSCLQQTELDRIPASWILKVIKHTIQSDVSGSV